MPLKSLPELSEDSSEDSCWASIYYPCQSLSAYEILCSQVTDINSTVLPSCQFSDTKIPPLKH